MTTSAPRSRQPKGLSTGGQFATEARAEAPGVALSAPAQPTKDQRITWLRGRYAMTDAVNPHQEGTELHQVWDQGHQSAEGTNPYDDRPVEGLSDAAYDRFMEEETVRLGSSPECMHAENEVKRLQSDEAFSEQRVGLLRQAVSDKVLAVAEKVRHDLSKTGEVHTDYDHRDFTRQATEVAQKLGGIDPRLIQSLPVPPREAARTLLAGAGSQAPRGSYTEAIYHALEPELLSEVITEHRTTLQTREARQSAEVQVDSLYAKLAAAAIQRKQDPAQRKDVADLRQVDDRHAALGVLMAGFSNI